MKCKEMQKNSVQISVKNPDYMNFFKIFHQVSKKKERRKNLYYDLLDRGKGVSDLRTMPKKIFIPKIIQVLLRNLRWGPFGQSSTWSRRSWFWFLCHSAPGQPSIQILKVPSLPEERRDRIILCKIVWTRNRSSGNRFQSLNALRLEEETKLDVMGLRNCAINF